MTSPRKAFRVTCANHPSKFHATSPSLAVILPKPPRPKKSQTRAMSAGNYSPRSSHDSDDSLRALELTEGPSGYSVANNSRTRASRSYSVSGFKFEQDLFQLSTTLDDPLEEGSGDLGEKKQIGFAKGVALCVGLQVRIRPSLFRSFDF